MAPTPAPARPKSRLLIVDPDPDPWDDVVRALEEAACEVAFADEEEALARLEAEEWAVLLASAGGEDDLLAEALRQPARPEVILFDDFGSLEDAVRHLREGAFDCLRRPTSDAQILLSIQRALAHRALRAENRRLREEVGERFAFGDVESRDPAMRRVHQVLESVADTRATLLLLGESGTGKTLLARAVHRRSGRAARPFVEVNCGALPSELLESELFGHARGSFTGAQRDHAGKFEQADGGTLLLDEIATASPDLQVKLLRVLQDRRFERVGDGVTREVDVRVIAATNVRLTDEVAAGRFREDLFYRLQVVSVEIPPLRERPSDVLFLAGRFLERFAAEYEREVTGFTAEARARLAGFAWPGNVRQLEHAIERAVLLSRGPLLGLEDLGDELRGPARLLASEAPGDLPLGPLRKVLEIPERQIVVRALQSAGGCRKEAAALLGINRTTLFNKMRKYDLLDLPGRGD